MSDTEKLKEGWYWVRPPGDDGFVPGLFTHGHDNDWVSIIGYGSVYDADLFEIGTRIEPPHPDKKDQSDE